MEKALQREFDFRIFDLICKGPLQKNYEKCKGFPTGHYLSLCSRGPYSPTNTNNSGS